ncbi:sperm acrosome-associated protein 7-like isoform X1 [Tamandua tetradactyla]|uniref:sperm acrosome-associated protein 7-like isoform X1 n=1 Tax=Tamandua tetradactyla TaxID=48850 RepID=UPI0040547799
MAASRGAVALLFVLLPHCWQEVEVRPPQMYSASITELPLSLRKLDTDMATVFDEILVQEMLDPNKSTLHKTQSKPTRLSSEKSKEKEEEKSTIFQIKSLAALEKIISSLRRTLGNILTQKRKHLHKAAKYLKGKSRLS